MAKYALNPREDSEDEDSVSEVVQKKEEPQKDGGKEGNVGKLNNLEVNESVFEEESVQEKVQTSLRDLNEHITTQDCLPVSEVSLEQELEDPEMPKTVLNSVSNDFSNRLNAALLRKPPPQAVSF